MTMEKNIDSIRYKKALGNRSQKQMPSNATFLHGELDKIFDRYVDEAFVAFNKKNKYHQHQKIDGI